MKYLESLVDIENFINTNEMTLIYFSTETCNVCHSLLPKVEEALKEFPKIELARVDMNDIKEAAGKYSVFTIPTIIVFINKKEYIRKSRFVGVEELKGDIQRYYSSRLSMGA